MVSADNHHRQVSGHLSWVSQTVRHMRMMHDSRGGAEYSPQVPLSKNTPAFNTRFPRRSDVWRENANAELAYILMTSRSFTPLHVT